MKDERNWDRSSFILHPSSFIVSCSRDAPSLRLRIRGSVSKTVTLRWHPPSDAEVVWRRSKSAAGARGRAGRVDADAHSYGARADPGRRIRRGDVRRGTDGALAPPVVRGDR